MELSSGRTGGGLRQCLEEFLASGHEAGTLADAVIASSEAQAKRLWRLREILPEAQTREGGSVKHDVSVPVSRVADFIRRATAMVEKEMQGVRVFAFGHIGDGNVHFNLTQPDGMEKSAFLSHQTRFSRMVHDLAVEMEGSFSAEHGIGRLKRDELRRYRSEAELELMRKVKNALDPDNIMNPGKVL